ncbi:hypothetical protein BT93_C1578 [Corymbia citriodora subsp. variegata]|nr:hypothetical protein BT93_C1578 [Corymbia citriodora subsp. variegata]
MPLSCAFVRGFLFTFLLAISASYIFVVPSLKHTFNGDNISQSNKLMSVCDVSEGSWVRDNSYPLYNASECPFAEQGFNCLGNGRTDKEYLKWRCKPKNCAVPRFDVRTILEWLRNRRLVFVGDSMSRSQWESLICLLMTGVEDKKSVYEVNGSKITKRIRFSSVHFSYFNFTIEFFRSVFLVRHDWMPRHTPRRVRSMLILDKLYDISSHWVDSDVLIFNTGQWGCYFQVGSSLKLGMSIPDVFKVALDTWASWVERAIDRK